MKESTVYFQEGTYSLDIEDIYIFLNHLNFFLYPVDVDFEMM